MSGQAGRQAGRAGRLRCRDAEMHACMHACMRVRRCDLNALAYLDLPFFLFFILFYIL